MWASEYTALTQSRPGAFGSATSRAPAQTLRLSLIFALLDGSEVIEEWHLRAAPAVWRYCEASARRIFGDATAILEAHGLACRRACQSEGIGRTGECWYPGPSIEPTDDDDPPSEQTSEQSATVPVSTIPTISPDSREAMADFVRSIEASNAYRYNGGLTSSNTHNDQDADRQLTEEGAEELLRDL